MVITEQNSREIEIAKIKATALWEATNYASAELDHISLSALTKKERNKKLAELANGLIPLFIDSVYDIKELLESATAEF